MQGESPNIPRKNIVSEMTVVVDFYTAGNALSLILDPHTKIFASHILTQEMNCTTCFFLFRFKFFVDRFCKCRIKILSVMVTKNHVRSVFKADLIDLFRIHDFQAVQNITVILSDLFHRQRIY